MQHLSGPVSYTHLDVYKRQATTGLGTLVLAMRPGDGSAREQAASCQRVLGGCANIAEDYATKRYRSNVVSWGMLPFILPNLKEYHLQSGDRVHLSLIHI